MPTSTEPAVSSLPRTDTPAAKYLLHTGVKRAAVLAFVVLLVGITITTWLYQKAHQSALSDASNRFEYRTNRIQEELEHRFTSYETALRSVAGLITARDGFNRSQWRRYFDTLHVAEPYEGRLLVGYAPRVSDAQRKAHERQAQAEGVEGYAILSSAPRSAYFPLAYIRRIAPVPGFVMGADLLDDPAARDGMARAIITGNPVLAGPLATSASSAEADQVWGLLIPVYADGKTPPTAPERETALLGFLIEAFAALSTVGGTLGPDAALIGLKVRDGDLPVFTCPELRKELAGGFQPTLTRDVKFEWGQRRWDLHFVALPGFMATAGPDPSLALLAAGATISLLFAALVGTLDGLRVYALRLVDQRTAALREALGQRQASEARLLAVFDHALDAILTIDTRGVVQSYNPAAERIFGWQANEVIGRNLNMLMPSPDHEQHDGYLANYLDGHAAKIIGIGIGRTVTGLRKDGSRVALELGVSEMRIGEQRYFCGIVRDITERQAAEQALRQSERKLRSYIEQSLDGVLVVDENGHYLEANPAVIELLGYPENELLSTSIAETLWPDEKDLREGMAHFERVVKSGRSKGEVTLRRRDGQRVVADINAVALGGNRFLGVVRDVTQRREVELTLLQQRETLEKRVEERTVVLTRINAALEQEVVERRRIEGDLVAAREQALQAADAKAGFLANMSHEIRTPMNAVLGMTALLDETPLDPEQRNYVETIRVSGDALLGIINDILDFSKIESGMLELERRPFELGTCVEEAFDMLAPRAAEKAIDLLYDVAEGIPQWLVGDPARLRQVFVNLLSNAVKFTDCGEVSMSASVVATEADRVQLHFAVRDTGIGISPAQIQHLFKAFSQADSSTTRKYGGTGLGLAISARLVRLMGGELGVDSEEHSGSTFHFTIPLGVARQMPAGRYHSGHAPELAGRRLLLVDDNPTNLHILQTQCGRWGMDVVTARRGSLALARLEAEPRFDVAVLDLHMPGMDGVQLAQSIRTQCGDRGPALVLLSSGVGRGERAGMDLFAAHLAKPVKHSQLFKVLAQVLHPEIAAARVLLRRRLDATLAQRLPMKILVVEDSAINQKLAVGILSKLGYASDVADNGQEALERVRTNRYGLVFMDLQMPVMDGLEATRRIVATLAPQDRPHIVAMTANAMAGDRERCLDAGMDDYIAKPILPSDMQALIERWGSPRAPAPDLIAEQPLIDASLVSELAALDEPGAPPLLQSLLKDFLDETLAVIVAIKQHAANGELPELSRRAHKLAGVSASLGASGVSDVCCRIEHHIASGQGGALPALIDELELRFARTRAELHGLDRFDL